MRTLFALYTILYSVGAIPVILLICIVFVSVRIRTLIAIVLAPLACVASYVVKNYTISARLRCHVYRRCMISIGRTTLCEAHTCASVCVSISSVASVAAPFVLFRHTD